MPRKPRLYRRLTRARSGLGSYTSLWMAPDHLLVVESTGFTEAYRRYFFRDIQGFLVTPGRTFVYVNVFGGLFWGLAALGLVWRAAEGGWSWPWGIFAGVMTLVLAVNLWLGPSCRVVVFTGLQSSPLKPLARRRKTSRVLARLEPLIREAQAGLGAAVAADPAKVVEAGNPEPAGNA